MFFSTDRCQQIGQRVGVFFTGEDGCLFFPKVEVAVTRVGSRGRRTSVCFYASQKGETTFQAERATRTASRVWGFSSTF